MKMKKKVISLIMLVALFAMQVMSVSAASKLYDITTNLHSIDRY